MKNGLIPWCAAGSLLLVGALASAGPPQLVAPQPRPVPIIPFGHYPTQWRPYPTMIVEPEIRILAPAEPPDLPNPMPVKPKHIEPEKPKLGQSTIDPKMLILPDDAPEPKSKLGGGPELIPLLKPVVSEQWQPATGSPEIRIPTAEPPILNPVVPADGFRRSEPAADTSDPKMPIIGKPKAWLELPVPVITPVVRASSHAPDSRLRPSAVWRPIPSP